MLKASVVCAKRRRACDAFMVDLNQGNTEKLSLEITEDARSEATHLQFMFLLVFRRST